MKIEIEKRDPHRKSKNMNLRSSKTELLNEMDWTIVSKTSKSVQRKVSIEAQLQAQKARKLNHSQCPAKTPDFGEMGKLPRFFVDNPENEASRRMKSRTVLFGDEEKNLGSNQSAGQKDLAEQIENQQEKSAARKVSHKRRDLAKKKKSKSVLKLGRGHVIDKFKQSPVFNNKSAIYNEREWKQYETELEREQNKITVRSRSEIREVGALARYSDEETYSSESEAVSPRYETNQDRKTEKERRAGGFIAQSETIVSSEREGKFGQNIQERVTQSKFKNSKDNIQVSKKMLEKLKHIGDNFSSQTVHSKKKRKRTQPHSEKQAFALGESEQRDYDPHEEERDYYYPSYGIYSKEGSIRVDSSNPNSGKPSVGRRAIMFEGLTGTSGSHPPKRGGGRSDNQRLHVRHKKPVEDYDRSDVVGQYGSVRVKELEPINDTFKSLTQKLEIDKIMGGHTPNQSGGRGKLKSNTLISSDGFGVNKMYMSGIKKVAKGNETVMNRSRPNKNGKAFSISRKKSSEKETKLSNRDLPGEEISKKQGKVKSGYQQGKGRNRSFKEMMRKLRNEGGFARNSKEKTSVNEKNLTPNPQDSLRPKPEKSRKKKTKEDMIKKLKKLKNSSFLESQGTNRRIKKREEYLARGKIDKEKYTKKNSLIGARRPKRLPPSLQLKSQTMKHKFFEGTRGNYSMVRRESGKEAELEKYFQAETDFESGKERIQNFEAAGSFNQSRILEEHEIPPAGNQQISNWGGQRPDRTGNSWNRKNFSSNNKSKGKKNGGRGLNIVRRNSKLKNPQKYSNNPKSKFNTEETRQEISKSRIKEYESESDISVDNQNLEGGKDMYLQSYNPFKDYRKESSDKYESDDSENDSNYQREDESERNSRSDFEVSEYFENDFHPGQIYHEATDNIPQEENEADKNPRSQRVGKKVHVVSTTPTPQTEAEKANPNPVISEKHIGRKGSEKGSYNRQSKKGSFKSSLKRIGEENQKSRLHRAQKAIFQGRGARKLKESLGRAKRKSNQKKKRRISEYRHEGKFSTHKSRKKNKGFGLNLMKNPYAQKIGGKKISITPGENRNSNPKQNAKKKTRKRFEKHMEQKIPGAASLQSLLGPKLKSHVGRKKNRQYQMSESVHHLLEGKIDNFSSANVYSKKHSQIREGGDTAWKEDGAYESSNPHSQPWDAFGYGFKKNRSQIRSKASRSGISRKRGKRKADKVLPSSEEQLVRSELPGSKALEATSNYNSVNYLEMEDSFPKEKLVTSIDLDEEERRRGENCVEEYSPIGGDNIYLQHRGKGLGTRKAKSPMGGSSQKLVNHHSLIGELGAGKSKNFSNIYRKKNRSSKQNHEIYNERSGKKSGSNFSQKEFYGVNTLSSFL